MLQARDAAARKGKRDRVIFALPSGCGVRRDEALRLTLQDIEQRDGRWVLIDLRRKQVCIFRSVNQCSITLPFKRLKRYLGTRPADNFAIRYLIGEAQESRTI